MQKTKLNPRSRTILLRLSQEESHIPVAAIAKELAVSAKTILRELPEVERILEACGVRLDKKAGTGIGLLGGDAARRRVCEFLEQSEAACVFTPQERQTVIISKLLQNQQPVKLYEFTSILKVTEGTISNDLDKLEPWVRRRELRLVRKPGLGVYIEGKEQNIRKAIVHYIYEHMNEEELLEVLHDNLAEHGTRESDAAAASKRHLLNLVDTKIIHLLEEAIRAAEERMNHKLADGAFVGLIVHLALAIQRIRKNEKIEMETAFLAELKEKKEFQVAERIGEEIARIFSLQVPEEEIGYITMHILGARNQYGKQDAKDQVVDNYHLVKLAQAMMRIAQEETGRPLMRNQKLLVGLVNHLGPAVSRLRMNLEIRNPLLQEMRQQYPALLRLAKKCGAAVERELDTTLPEAEVAYIAMHIGAALDENAVKREYRVAVACPTGMGTSRMLAMRICREYDNIKVVELVSALRIDEAQLRRMRVEMIISTVAVKRVSMPVIVVSSLLSGKDRDAIAACMEQLSKAAPPAPKERAGAASLVEKVEAMQRYGNAVLSLLQYFFLLEVQSKQVADVIEVVAQRVCETPRESVALGEALLRRESYGGTKLAEFDLLLLHCRDRAVPCLQCGIARLPEDFEGGTRTALVLLAPQECGTPELETIGCISEALLNRWEFAETLHKGDKAQIDAEFTKIFADFYQSKYKTIMEE